MKLLLGRFLYLMMVVALIGVMGAGCATTSSPSSSSSRAGVTTSRSKSTSSSTVSAARVRGGDVLDVRRFAYAGLPVMVEPGDYVTLTNRGFIVGYDESRKIARWVCFSLHKVAEPGKRITANDIGSPWRTDNRTRSKVKDGDYTRSGYSRGHMAQRASIDTRYGPEAQRETFLMSNAVPQLQSVNDIAWGDLEDQEDLFYANSYGRIWVIYGPVLKGATHTIGDSRVPVPSGFYRIQVMEIGRKTEVQAFYVAHATGATAKLVSVDELESLAGADFLRDLPDPMEFILEAAVRRERIPPR